MQIVKREQTQRPSALLEKRPENNGEKNEKQSG
jgi:hypothetical protein